MGSYSKSSQKKLETCHIDIQTIMNVVVKLFDNTIVCGNRGKTAQDLAYSEGKSTLKYPDSKHNEYPSKAVDSVSYPIVWEDVKQHYYFAGYVKAVGDMLYEQGKISHRVRAGADWNKNMQVSDETFMDLFHFELYLP